MEFLCCLFPVFLCAPLLVDSLRAVRATLRVECLRAFWVTVVLGIPPALLAMLAVDAGRVPSPPWLLVPLDWLAAALCLGAVFVAALLLRLRYAPTPVEKVDPEDLTY